MTQSNGKFTELDALLAALCDHQASPNDLRQIERLAADAEAFEHVLDYLRLDGLMRWEYGQRVESRELRVESEGEWPESPDSRIPNPEIPRFSLPSPLSSLPSAWAFSYSVATVFLAIFLLGAWSYTITHPPADSLARKSSRSATPFREVAKEPSRFTFVGHVSGMVDCQWAEDATATYPGAAVALNRRYALKSGLMEITYDSGAKVILQGPCDYTVESPSGGFLKVGKLTARVVSGEWRVASAKPQAANPESPNSRTPIPKSPSPHAPRPTPLFAVRTPTATVEDLGTEFGVEVSASGETASHVFQGRVVMRVQVAGDVGHGTGDENPESAIQHPKSLVLAAGQSARVERDAAGRNIALRHADGQTQFVRELPAHKEPPDIVLIGKLDYSDTWTLQTPARPGSYAPLENPESLRVEQCHGNPARSWILSAPAAATTWPSGEKSMSWPGFASRGTRSGFTERSGFDGVCYLSIEYGLRDDFIVQFDAVQTQDRINITIGDGPATIYADRSLSVFFRAPGGKHPEIGLHTPSRGEVDSGLRSGISTPFQWHNYAVRFNLRDKCLTVWVDGNCRGTIDLARFSAGTDNERQQTWADLPWTNQYVTIGGFNDNNEGQVWTDNFRIGVPLKTCLTDATTTNRGGGNDMETTK